MADAKSGSRERGEGKLRRRAPGSRGPPKRSAANTTGSLGPRIPRTDSEDPLPRSFSGPADRGGRVPSPTPAKGNGARRLRAGKAFGQSGLRQRPLRNSPRPTATRVAAFPRPDHGGGWPGSTPVGAHGLAVPFLITH